MKGLEKIHIDNWHRSQRGYFAGALYNQMVENKKVWLLVGDLGYHVFDNQLKDFPERVINCGAAEHGMMDIAVGLALEGKVPFVYSITPFLLYRAFEVLRTYINHEVIPVKLVGSGRNNDYHIDGYSHFAGDDKQILACLPNIKTQWPQILDDIPDLVEDMVLSDKPQYINLSRT